MCVCGSGRPIFLKKKRCTCSNGTYRARTHTHTVSGRRDTLRSVVPSSLTLSSSFHALTGLRDFFFSLYTLPSWTQPQPSASIRIALRSPSAKVEMISTISKPTKKRKKMIRFAPNVARLVNIFTFLLEGGWLVGWLAGRKNSCFFFPSKKGARIWNEKKKEVTWQKFTLLLLLLKEWVLFPRGQLLVHIILSSARCYSNFEKIKKES